MSFISHSARAAYSTHSHSRVITSHLNILQANRSAANELPPRPLGTGLADCGAPKGEQRERERDGAPQGVLYGGGTATKPVFNKDTHKTMFSFCVIFRKRFAPGFTQSLTEMSTGKFGRGEARPACKVDNLTAICEPIV
jgi:hypothetical protein